MRGQTEPRTRVRKLYQVDLWEISIVTFPLLNGARVAAVKEAPQSRLRARAEQEWQAVQQDMQNLDLNGAADAPAPFIRRGGAEHVARCPARPRRSQTRAARRGGASGGAVMSKYQDIYDAHQRARFMRPDAARFMRPDAARYIRPDVARFLKPGTNPADVFPALDRKYSPNQRRIPAGRPGGGR